jgi:3-phosphoshikimate 1-carboxyvinyltransferase
MKIHPARRIRGCLALPGDKSISHRAAMLAAIADGQTRLSNFSTAEDCASTLNCLRQLGVSIERAGASVKVNGAGARGLRASAARLDCGNSGSTMRMLAGLLAGQDFVSELTGDDSLRSRPMRRVIEPLEWMGASIASAEGRAPLRISGRQPLAPIRYEMKVASAQVKSCILLAGLNARGRTEVLEETGVTRDHTERMLRWFGFAVETLVERHGEASRSVIAIDGPARLKARDVMIPGDISSATFFIVAAALLPGSELLLEAIGLNPTRSQILSTLQTFGLDAQATNLREQSNEPIGDIRVGGNGVTATSGGEATNVLRGPVIARLIDELPALAVVGTQLPGGLEIREAEELRHKESDRISAMVCNLRAMGATVEEFDDGLRVGGRARLRGARLEAREDHRIAMACAVAALLAEGESEIAGAECASVSFPEFFQLLEAVVER